MLQAGKRLMIPSFQGLGLMIMLENHGSAPHVCHALSGQ